MRTVTVCGIVDASSTLPTTLVLATGGTRKVTIQNTKPSCWRPGSSPAPTCAPRRSSSHRSVAAKARHPKRTKVLLYVKVRPAAPSRPRAVTLGPVRSRSRRSSSPSRRLHAVAEGHRRQGRQGHRLVRLAGGPIVLKRSAQPPSATARTGTARGDRVGSIAGRVSDLAAAHGDTPGSVKVGGIMLVDPGRQGAPRQGRRRRVRRRQRQGQERRADAEEGQGGEQGRRAGGLAPRQNDHRGAAPRSRPRRRSRADIRSSRAR